MNRQSKILHLFVCLAPTGSPTNISTQSVTSSSFTLNWELPQSSLRNGLVRYFIVSVTENETQTVSSYHVFDTMRELVGLHPYYNYIVEISAFTVDEGPFSSPITVTTLEAGTCLITYERI